MFSSSLFRLSDTCTSALLRDPSPEIVGAKQNSIVSLGSIVFGALMRSTTNLCSILVVYARKISDGRITVVFGKERAEIAVQRVPPEQAASAALRSLILLGHGHLITTFVIGPR